MGDEADSSLLAALARRNDKDFGFMRGSGVRSVEDCHCKRESKSPPCRKMRDKGGAPSSLRGLWLRDGVKPFCGGDRLNRIWM